MANTSDDFDLFGNYSQSSSSAYPSTNVGPSGPMVGPSGPMVGPSGPMVGPSGPMIGPSGPGLTSLSQKAVKDPDATYTQCQPKAPSAKKPAKKAPVAKAKKPVAKKKA